MVDRLIKHYLDHEGDLDGQSFAKKHADKDVEFVTIVGVSDVEEFNEKYPREDLAVMNRDELTLVFRYVVVFE